METELGGKISGAQASLFHLAKSALDDALPLLAGINPLLPKTPWAQCSPGRPRGKQFASIFPAVTVGDRIEAILRDANGNAIQALSILVGELLGWVLRFARDEGRALIRDGGRIGVASMQPAAERLRKLVLGALEAPVPHVGFTRNRVKRPLSELAAQVGYVAALATELADAAAA